MHNPTSYLKMRVLGPIDMAEGNSIVARIRAVAQMTFTDEDGHARQFTWRTIQTWYSYFVALDDSPQLLTCRSKLSHRLPDNVFAKSAPT